MEEFKKWKDNNCVKHCNLCHIGVCGDCTGIGTKEDVWKAALEMVMKKGMHHYGNDFLTLNLCKDIRKELGK